MNIYQQYSHFSKVHTRLLFAMMMTMSGQIHTVLQAGGAIGHILLGGIVFCTGKGRNQKFGDGQMAYPNPIRIADYLGIDLTDESNIQRILDHIQ